MTILVAVTTSPLQWVHNSNQTTKCPPPRKFKKEPLTSNLNSFKLLRAKARKTIKQAKKISWQNYINKLNSSTKTNTVWKMIRKISGKNQSTPLKHLIKNNTQVTNKKDIVNTLAETFSENPSSTNSNTKFHKDKKEKQRLNFKSGSTKSYNELFIIRTKRSHPKIPQHCSRPRLILQRIFQTINCKILRIPTYCIKQHLEK